MARAFVTGLLLFAWLAGISQDAVAELQEEMLQRSLKATALVEKPNREGFGTAFCINENGYFMTNRHVVEGIKLGGTVNLVLSPGSSKDQPIPATVIGVEQRDDLAVLYAPGAKGTPALAIGDSGKLRETMQITAFGYPFGDLLSLKEQRYPNISVNVGRISSLRGDRANPSYIQTDAALNVGNSGGPMLDEQGRVIGVVAAGVPGSGVSMAIPVSKVRAMLQKPRVDFELPRVVFAKRYDPVELKVTAGPILPGSANISLVTVEVERSDKPESYQATPASDGKYLASIAILKRPQGPTLVQVEIAFDNGLVRGWTNDRLLKIGSRTIMLSKLVDLTRINSDFKATTAGPSHTGKLAEATHLPVRIGDHEVAIDLGRAQRVTVMAQEPELEEVKVAVIAVTKTGESVRAEQVVRIVGVPASVDAAKQGSPANGAVVRSAIQPMEPISGESRPLGEEPIVVDLPGAFSAVRSGGAGRYLIFHIPAEKQLSVVDVTSAKIAATIPLQSEQVLYAANAQKLMIVLPGERLIQRWDLATFTRERMTPVPTAKTPLEVKMGCSSSGPLWLWGGGKIEPFDVQRMRLIEVIGEVLSGDPEYGYRMLISADGSTMTAWNNGLSSPPYELMRIRGRRTFTMSSPFGEGYNGRWMWPNADGSLIFGHGARVFNYNFQEIAAKWLEGGSIVPTIDRRFFILVKSEKEGRKSTVSICTSNDRKIIYSLPSIENVTKDSHLEWGRIGGEPRVYYAPSSGTLVTLPVGEEEVIFRRIGTPKELVQSSASGLFVDSFVPSEAQRGRPWRYQISAQGGKGRLAYSLESGPQGMAVDADGMVTWNIPIRVKEERVAAIVSIRDEAGDEVLHSIQFEVTDDSR